MVTKEKKAKNCANSKKFRKTKRGLISSLHSGILQRTRVSGLPCDVTLTYLTTFADCKRFNRLFNEWAERGYNKQFKPTIDRISRNKGYLKDNINWLTWAENSYKLRMELRNRTPTVEQLKDGKVIATYKSQRDTVKKMGINYSTLSQALRGKNKTALGFEWRYKAD